MVASSARANLTVNTCASVASDPEGSSVCSAIHTERRYKPECIRDVQSKEDDFKLSSISLGDSFRKRTVEEQNNGRAFLIRPLDSLRRANCVYI